MHRFNSYFSLCVFSFLLVTYQLLCILYSFLTVDMILEEKKFKGFSRSSSK